MRRGFFLNAFSDSVCYRIPDFLGDVAHESDSTPHDRDAAANAPVNTEFACHRSNRTCRIEEGLNKSVELWSYSVVGK